MGEQAPAEETAATQQAVEAVYRHAIALMDQGMSDRAVEKDLIDKGLEAESAATIVSHLREARSNAAKEASRKNMLYGGLWFVGGVLVTAITYGAASDGGGRYVVAWGAIIFGAIQFFRGLSQSGGE